MKYFFYPKRRFVTFAPIMNNNESPGKNETIIIPVSQKTTKNNIKYVNEPNKLITYPK